VTVLAVAKIVLTGDTVALTTALRGAEASMRQSGVRLSAIGKTLSTRVTLPILAMGVGVAKAFGDFDSAMTQSIAIMGDVSDVLKNQMAEAAKDVARETTTSAKVAAEAFFFLASAGLDAEQSIAALPQVARFAQAGMFGMAQATDLATDAQSALGLSVQDAQQNLVNLTRVTDVLVKANTLANATVGQFSEALTREAGAALKTFQIDIEEGVAVLAAFADQGVKSQLAGTALARILRLMTSAAVKNKTELRKLNISIFDSQGKIRNLADIIEDMENAFIPMSDEMRTASLESIGFTAKVQGIILPLLGTSDAIREYEAALRDAAGITKEVADKQLEAFSAQMKITWNNIVLAAIALGETLAPALLRVGGFVRDFAMGVAATSNTTRIWILRVVGLVAVIGPLLIALGALIKLIAALKIVALTTAFIGWARAVGALVIQVNSLSAALALVKIAIGPAGWVILGVGAIIGAVVLWTRAQKDLGAELITTAQRLDDYRTGLIEFTKAQLALQRSQILEREQEVNRVLSELRAELLAVGRTMRETERGAMGPLISRSAVLTAEIKELTEELDLLGQHSDAVAEQIEKMERAATALAAATAVAAGNTAGLIVDVDAVAEALKDFAAVTGALAGLEEVLGAEFNAQAAEAGALRAAIEALSVAGVKLDFVLNTEGLTLRELGERYRELQREIKDATEFQDELTAAEVEARQVTLAVMTPLEKYAATIKRLRELRAAGLSQEAFNRAMAAAQEILNGTAEAADRWGDAIKTASARALNSITDFTTGILQGMTFGTEATRRYNETVRMLEAQLDEGRISQDQFNESVNRAADAADRAKVSFGQFFSNLFRDLARLATRIVILQFLESIGVSETVIQGLQHGGVVTPGQLALVGETGPELIRAGRGGLTVQPLQGRSFAAAGGGERGAQVSVTIQAVDARSFAELVERNPSAVTAPVVRALQRSRVLQGIAAR